MSPSGTGSGIRRRRRRCHRSMYPRAPLAVLFTSTMLRMSHSKCPILTSDKHVSRFPTSEQDLRCLPRLQRVRARRNRSTYRLSSVSRLVLLVLSWRTRPLPLLVCSWPFAICPFRRASCNTVNETAELDQLDAVSQRRPGPLEQLITHEIAAWPSSQLEIQSSLPTA